MILDQSLFVYIWIDIHDMQELSLSIIWFWNELKLICLRASIDIVSTLLNGFNYWLCL